MVVLFISVFIVYGRKNIVYMIYNYIFFVLSLVLFEFLFLVWFSGVGYVDDLYLLFDMFILLIKNCIEERYIIFSLRIICYFINFVKIG